MQAVHLIVPCQPQLAPLCLRFPLAFGELRMGLGGGGCHWGFHRSLTRHDIWRGLLAVNSGVRRRVKAPLSVAGRALERLAQQLAPLPGAFNHSALLIEDRR